MDCIIRNIDVVAVKKIDELARKKGISRNEYLKQLIEAHAMSGLTDNATDKYSQLVQETLSLWRDVINQINEMKSAMFREE